MGERPHHFPWIPAALFIIVTSGAGCIYPKYAFDLQESADQEGVADAGGGKAGATGDAGGASRDAAIVTGPEDCTNGSDDDGDGLVDCEDPDCAAYACVGSPPPAWSGPFALYDETSSQPIPDCPPLFDGPGTLDLGDDPSAEPARCSPCTCTAPAEMTCAVTATIWGDSQSCGGDGCLWPDVTFTPDTCLYHGDLDRRACNGWPTNGLISKMIATGGSCAPSPQTPTLPPYAWREKVRLCAPFTTGGGCGSKVCAPKSGGQYQTSLCILRSDDVSCPSGPYSVKHLFHSARDTRSCTDCSCASCAGALRAYNDDACTSTDELAAMTADSGCGNFSTGASSFRYDPGPNPCVPAGGQPQGDVTVDDAYTICCMQ